MVFNQDKYKKTGWMVALKSLDFDGYKPRLIVRVATGRKYWCLFTEIVNLELGAEDPALIAISASLLNYTFPMVERFVLELEEMLTDLYKVQITLIKPNYINYLNRNK
jgi:hypothetical protein